MQALRRTRFRIGSKSVGILRADQHQRNCDSSYDWNRKVAKDQIEKLIEVYQISVEVVVFGGAVVAEGLAVTALLEAAGLPSELAAFINPRRVGNKLELTLKPKSGMSPAQFEKQAQELKKAIELLNGKQVGKFQVGTSKMDAVRAPRITERWTPRDITDPKFSSGCESVARQIQKQIGGEVKRIVPKTEGLYLGPHRGHSHGWFYHEVVVKDGRVYDLFTGHKGLSIAEYKKLWQYAGEINFGF